MDQKTRHQIAKALIQAARHLDGAPAQGPIKASLHPRVAEGLNDAEAFVAEKMKEEAAKMTEWARNPEMAARVRLVEVRELERFPLPSLGTLNKWAATKATKVMTEALAGTGYEATDVASVRKSGTAREPHLRVIIPVKYVGP